MASARDSEGSLKCGSDDFCSPGRGMKSTILMAPGLDRLLRISKPPISPRHGAPLARHLLVRIRHMNHTRDAGELDDQRIVDAPVVTDEPDRRALCAGHRGGCVSHRPNCFAYAIDVFLRGLVRHHYEHRSEPR